MAFGPKTFENLNELLHFVTNEALKDPEDRTTHPLRTAIAKHIRQQSVSENDEIPTNLTRVARARLSDIFKGEATATKDTAEEYIIHCFWDGLRKSAGTLSNAQSTDYLKESILNAATAIGKTHHLILAQLKANVYFYNKNYGGQNNETNEEFEHALSYIKETLIPELERNLAKEFASKPIDLPKFKEEWTKIAADLCAISPMEAQEGPPRKSPTGKTYPTFPNQFGYDGLKFTHDCLEINAP